MKKADAQTWVNIRSVDDLKQLSGQYDTLVLFFDDHCVLDLTDQQFNIHANTIKLAGPIMASDKLLSIIMIRPDTFRIHTTGGRGTFIFESLRVIITKDPNNATPLIMFTKIEFHNCIIAFKWRNGLNIGSDNIIQFKDCRFDNDGYLNCQYDSTQVSFSGGTALVKKKLIHIDEDATNIKIDMNHIHITFKEPEPALSCCVSLGAVTMNTTCHNCDIAMYSVRYHKPINAPKLLANIINYYGDGVNGVSVNIRTILGTVGPHYNLQQSVAYLSFHVLTTKAPAPYELIQALNVSCKVALEQLDNN